MVNEYSTLGGTVPYEWRLMSPSASSSLRSVDRLLWEMLLMYFFSSPNPLCFICTKREDGGSNFASVSWYTYLSYNPGMMAFAMRQPSYSGARVRATGKAVLAVLAFPGEGLEKLVGQAGSSTGHKIDKAQSFGTKMEAVEGADIEIPSGCAGGQSS